MKLKAKFKKYLIAACIGILAMNIAIGFKVLTKQPEEMFKYIEKHEALDISKYTISQEMILSKLKAKAQIVSLEQSIAKKDVNVDKGFFGDRVTELKLKGSFQMGLDTKDIKIRDIDDSSGTIFIQLPDPVLINLDIPFDQVEFNKTEGWARLAINDEQERNFYKAAKKHIENELLKDKDVIEQAELHNQKVIEDILKLIPQVKNVVFE